MSGSPPKNQIIFFVFQISCKELHNPDFSFLMRIRRTKVNPCRAQKIKKCICFFLTFLSYYFWGKLIFWKPHQLRIFKLKVPPSGGRGRVLTPSLRITDSYIQNLVFRRLVLFLWFFIVFQNNYGGDSKSLFQTRFLFWFVVPSRSRLRQLYIKLTLKFKILGVLGKK